ncbi:MAG: flippase [Solirubrobacteraceae bacterium]
MSESPPSSGPPLLNLNKVIRGTGLLIGAQIAGQIIGFAILALVSRRLGPTYLGAYQFDTQMVAWCGIAAVLGLPVLASRDIAMATDDAAAVFSETIMLRVVLSVIVFAALMLLAPVIAPDHATRSILPIAGAMLFVNALTLDWALNGLQRQGALATSRILGQVAYGAVMPLFLAGGLAGARAYAAVNVFGAAVTSLTILYFLRSRLRLRLPTMSSVGRRLRKAAPFAWSLAMVQVYYSIDFLMLGYLDTTREVGLYGIAYRIPLAVVTFASLWMTALYPAVAVAAMTDRKSIGSQLGKAITLACVIGLSLVLVVPVSSGIISEMFGDQFAAAGSAFAVLMLTTAVILVSVTIGNALLAVGDERRYAIGVTVGALTNLALNVALIPLLGVLGAAISTLAAELAVLIYMVARYRIVVGPIELNGSRIKRALGAALLSLFIVQGLSLWLPALVAVSVGTLAYGGVAVALGALPSGDLIFWRKT